MAGTTLERHGFIGQPESTLRDLVIQFNKLVADVELVRAAVIIIAAQLDADGGVTDTDYEANVATIATAAELLAAKIGDHAGTVVSA